jgi:hypothetical protein
MVYRTSILGLARRIAAELDPEKIIHFGSYATGKPSPDSDVDLPVILPFKERPLRQSAEREEAAVALRIAGGIRKRAKGDVGDPRTSELTPPGARLAPSLRAAGGGLRRVLLASLDRPPLCLWSAASPCSPGAERDLALFADRP